MFVFFFKQKTAYEMRISDWSSDVCSSDLPFPAIEIIAIFAAIAIASGPAHDFNDLRPFDGEQLFIFCAQGSEPRRGDVVGSVVHPRSLRDFRKKGKSRMDVIPADFCPDRKNGGEGKSVAVRLDRGGRGVIKKKKIRSTN